MLVATLLALSGSAHALDMASLAGTWNVTATETSEGTCGGTPGKTLAYVWIVGTEPTGAVTVAVQGETTFPKLSGTFASFGGQLVVSGLTTFTLQDGDFWQGSASHFRLQVQPDGSLKGTRTWLGWTNTTLGNGQKGYYPCSQIQTVTARHG